MLLRANVENHEIEFRFDKPRHTSRVLNYYFSEFHIKMNASIVNEEVNLEKIKVALINAFESIADCQNYQLEGNEMVFQFKYKELVGVPFLDAFEIMARLQGKIIMEKLADKADIHLYLYKVEITIASLYPSRSLK